MQKILLILFSLVVTVFGETWEQKAKVKNYTEYFAAVVQETAYELERFGWCNFKLTNVSQNINLQMYSLRVNGTVQYTNGFLVSIKKLEVTNMRQQVLNGTIDGVAAASASVRGQFIMWNATLGYDVVANLTDFGEQRYTGEIMPIVITWNFHIIKNLNKNEITISISFGISGGLTVRMAFRPENQITEVLSRNFFPYHTYDGVQTWREIIEPILLDIVRNKVEFPDICFTDC